jgi:type III restriction enzyme
VRALEDRAHLEITCPRVAGYRYDVVAERLEAAFDPASRRSISSADVATITENAPIVGKSAVLGPH